MASTAALRLGMSGGELVIHGGRYGAVGGILVTTRASMRVTRIVDQLSMRRREWTGSDDFKVLPNRNQADDDDDRRRRQSGWKIASPPIERALRLALLALASTAVIRS